jgi:hypothetical protein
MLSWHMPERIEENVRSASILAKIGTKHLLNMILQCYCYVNLHGACFLHLKIAFHCSNVFEYLYSAATPSKFIYFL